MEGLRLISAISADGAIGHDDQLLWHISEDLKKYKEKTLGNIVIVGLNTFMGMPVKAFKGRLTIIVCGDMADELKKEEGTSFTVNTPYDALDLAEKLRINNEKIYVIGGQMLYESLIDEVEIAEITWVNALYPDANKRFPIYNLIADFTEVENTEWIINTEDELEYKFTTYKRK